MFKKFSSTSSHQVKQPKSSALRKIKSLLSKQFPSLNDATLDEILPKKSQIHNVKPKDVQHVEIITVDAKPAFFKYNDDFYPTLQLLHKYPQMMQKQTVDRGAVKFVLSGADIMCPGLTSPGGEVDQSVEEGAVVAIMVEGKENALAMGKMLMSGKDIVKKNKGMAIQLIHYMDDGLYRTNIFDQIKLKK